MSQNLFKMNKHTKIKAHHASPAVSKEKGPDYVVQVRDPKMVRKDILEGLREVIIFMQGHERFRQIQLEKVSLFNTLRSDVRQINSLIDGKMRSYFPKGKIKGIKIAPQEAKPVEKKQIEPDVPEEEEDLKIIPPVQKEAPAYQNELDELESQLKDIEGQLRNVR